MGKVARTVTHRDCNRFYETVQPVTAGKRVDDGSELWVCEYTFVVDASLDGVEYRGIGTKRNDLRDGSEQVINARANPLFGFDEGTERYLQFCRKNIVTLTALYARNEAIKQIIVESGWR